MHTHRRTCCPGGGPNPAPIQLDNACVLQASGGGRHTRKDRVCVHIHTRRALLQQQQPGMYNMHCSPRGACTGTPRPLSVSSSPMERATLRNPVCITPLPAVLASYATTQRLLSPQRKANPPGVLLAAGTPATCRTMLPATPCGCCLMHPDAARLPAHRPAAMPAAGMQQCMQQADSQHSQPQREPAACRHPTHWSTSKACDDPAPPAQLCNPCHTAHQRRTCHMHAL
jgi:hypothetical protein